MGLKNDLIRVSSSNLIVLISSIINGLLLPYILSIDNFADFKTYILFVSFVGFLHFGFVDGINIKYGGFSEKEVDNNEFKLFHNFFLLFQFIILFLVIGIGFVTCNKIILLVGLSVLPVNLQSFFLFYYQALGSFKEYSKATVIAPLTSISLTLVLVLLGVKEFQYYVLSNIIGFLLSSIYLEFKFQNLTKNSGKFKMNSTSLLCLIKRKENKVVFISGIFILLGNMIFGLFFDLGMWMVKIYFNNEGFANFALGVSLISFIIIFINTINKTFYPYLFHNFTKDIIKKYKSILYVLGSFSLIGFFLIREMVILFLPKYVDSLPITSILISSIPGMLIVKSIYANSYKILKKEKDFMFDSLKYLAIAIVITVLSFFYFKSLNSIALGSVCSIYIWTLIPLNNFHYNYREQTKEFVYIFLILAGFYFVIHYSLNMMFSIIVYFAYLVLINLFFYKRLVLNWIKGNKLF
jgi:O-antigen/teichoic acid export membrane protein